MIKLKKACHCAAWLLLLCSGAALGQIPAIGSPAPDFRLQDQDSHWHTLSEYKGQWLALYFYPKDNSPGCTTQACEFRDNVFGFKEAGAVIVGISVDTVDSHKKFESDHKLPFTLLADPTKQTSKAYGVLKSYIGLAELAKRETFLIDPEGRIAKRYADVTPKGHSQQVLADIKALKERRK